MATIIRDGTSQEDRMLPALRPDYVRPDEMALPELLFLGARHARLLSYFDLANRPAGDWSSLFASDESALMGAMLFEASRAEARRLELQGFLDRVRALALGVGPCPGPEDVPAYRLAERIQEWRAGCRRNAGPAARRLHHLMDGLLTATLAPALTGLAAFLARHDPRHQEILDQRFPDWRADGPVPLPAPDAAPGEVVQFMADHGLAFLNALAVIRKAAEELFPASLASGDHDPAMGLYLAFAALYRKAKGGIDDFSQRQLRFYYDRVLRFRPREAEPDSTYLVLAADGATAESLVPRGTLFIGGEAEDGSERLYAADDDLRVTDARVAALQTLYFDRDPRHSPEKDLGYATSARLANLPAAPGKQYYPLFGAPRKAGLWAPGEHARLGFALASPVLLLGEGQREITVTLHCQPTGEGIESLVDKLRAIIPTASREGTFFKAFAGIFRIRVTVADGWRQVPDFIPGCSFIDPRLPADSLSIQIKLPEDFPPVVAYDPAIHGEAYDTDSPVASFAIEPDTYLYPYDFLSRLAVKEVDIAVQVTGCRDLLLYNNHGELSAATPFSPFGPLPKVGAPFIVGSREAFAKHLTGLELRVKWDDLPAGGLEDNYRAYGLGLGPASFRAELGALGERTWQPDRKAERIDLSLFGNMDEAGWVRYDCARLLPYTRVAAPGSPYAYSPQARGGFIRLTLAAPAEAFGHAAYPILLARALTRNARLESLGAVRRLAGRRGAVPLPEPPYTPQIGSISLDYSALARISLHQHGGSDNRDRVFHLHPAGVERLRLDVRGDTRLIPALAEDAHLCIGIAAAELGGVISLYFHLRNDSEMDLGMERPAFTWYHLKTDRWQQLEGFRVLSDSTRGFLTSGVVKLDLPRDMVRDNTVMPGGLYWLRLSARGPAAALCSVYGVQAHGVRVTRVPGTGPDALPVLPAGSIEAAKVTIPGIAAIEQPGDSFGGQPRESLEAMTVRASERLKHRQRAVTPWDYERLVLQRFPHLHKVKCFPNTRFTAGPEGWRQPGHLLVVAVPRITGLRDSSEGLRENVLVLQDIKDYLERFASPFAAIDVRNPVFERIQVRCAVRFRDDSARGQLIKEINRAICDFISPWGGPGNTANFGWSLHSQELQGYLQGLPYVQSVWGLSLLRVVDNGPAGYALHDTARQGDEGLSAVAPIYPWSLAIPFRHHLVETETDGRSDPNGPWPSGISQLQVGATFILSGEQHGEKE
ncbi:MAG: hypothetical protein H6R10_1061 [Rhodocyclaceae bacterium]|nr:hypothetical protein [Rhodocyclaceae bacterium]